MGVLYRTAKVSPCVGGVTFPFLSETRVPHGQHLGWGRGVHQGWRKSKVPGTLIVTT